MIVMLGLGFYAEILPMIAQHRELCVSFDVLMHRFREAVFQGDIVTVQDCVAKGVDVNADLSWGEPGKFYVALHHVTSVKELPLKNNLSLVRTLLACGADSNIEWNGLSAADLANTILQDMAVVNCILEYGLRPLFYPQDLCDAIKKNDLETVKCCSYKDTFHINVGDISGKRAIHLVAEFDRIMMFEILRSIFKQDLNVF